MILLVELFTEPKFVVLTGNFVELAAIHDALHSRGLLLHNERVKESCSWMCSVICVRTSLVYWCISLKDMFFFLSRLFG